MTLFDRILAARNILPEQQENFLLPDYSSRHNPFLLPDMQQAVERLVAAHASQEKITIYGDYDIDGLTATTVLLDSLEKFGFQSVDAFIPNRFVEGYGLTVEAIEKIAATGATLVVTVDCGSLSHEPIARAKELGVDVIVTDHHNVATVQPDAVAIINPKRLLAEYPDKYEAFLLKEPAALYPFLDLAGVGVAFKLVQALQTKLTGLPAGQEKWLLDLVALGTVCDVVTLIDENRTNVFWGLKVLAKTRREGLRALMKVSSVEPNTVNARSLGFALGPRMNAAGRLETAQFTLDLLRATNAAQAMELALKLDTFNRARRSEQDDIFAQAVEKADEREDDPVLVVSSEGWNHGIIGIVAAKLLEKFKKPTFVLEEMGEEAKGSARSYGDFSAADAIRAAEDIITKGGGHKLAAGVTLPTKSIAAFRARVNEFYRAQNLENQAALLLPVEDTVALFEEVTEQLLSDIAQLEPFGNGNPEPVLKTQAVVVLGHRRMGADGQHVKLEIRDEKGGVLQFIAFNAPAHFFLEANTVVDIWYKPTLNEWNGRRSIEGQLLHLEVTE